MPDPTTYLQVAMVRLLCKYLTTDEISDDDLEDIAITFADPEIDAALKGFGAPFGYTNPPLPVRILSALITTAIAFDSVFAQTADESRFASAKRSTAQKMIDRIRAGEIDLGIVEDDPLIDVSESDLEERPAEEVFVGNELDWVRPTEAREA